LEMISQQFLFQKQKSCYNNRVGQIEGGRWDATRAEKRREEKFYLNRA
jgi:hypothetical protein